MTRLLLTFQQDTKDCCSAVIKREMRWSVTEKAVREKTRSYEPYKLPCPPSHPYTEEFLLSSLGLNKPS